MKGIFYDWSGANVWLFYLINGVHGPLGDRFMLLGTEIGSHSLFVPYLGMAVLFALVVVSRQRGMNRDLALETATRWLSVIGVFAVAYVVSGLMIAWLKSGLDFPRPPAVLPQGTVHVLGEPEYRRGFPSGHSAFAMMVAASLWPVFGRWWKIVSIVFVIWVGVSRVAVGAHFPADVMGGYVLSLALVLLVNRLVAALIKPRSGKTAKPLAPPGSGENADAGAGIVPNESRE